MHVEPVAHVAFVRQVRQLDDADSLRGTMQRRRGLKCLFAAGLVVVFEDEDVAAGERPDAVVRPVAARDRGRATLLE
jgi:hypothetical protein